MKTQPQYQEQFLRIGKIAGMFYTIPGRKTNRITLYGIGAPLPPDEGNLSDASTILSFDTDLFVVDYIGYGRSDGIFTPKNIIKTFLDVYHDLKTGVTATCSYEGKEKYLKYNDFHFMGRSFGASYVPLLPRFDKSITNICSIFPVVDWATLGSRQPEETVEGFLKAMKADGYKHLYRGILDKKCIKHFQGKDDLSLVKNIKYLETAKLFVGHGKTDKNINFTHSVDYFTKIQKYFPQKKSQFSMKLYPYDHSRKTSNRAVLDYFTWMKVPKK